MIWIDETTIGVAVNEVNGYSGWPMHCVLHTKNSAAVACGMLASDAI